LTRGLIALASLGGLAALGAIVVAGAPRARALDGFVLFLGALLMAWLVHATRRASGAAGLEQAERVVVLAAVNSFDLHLRLRPRLQAIAAHRLASRRGLRLDSREAREVLGEELWELLRPERPTPDDRFAPGLPLAGQRAALDRIEKI
jgi:hypothetical protein